MELRFVEDRDENLFREDMLNQHFTDVLLRHLRVDGLFAQLPELLECPLKLPVYFILPFNAGSKGL